MTFLPRRDTNERERDANPTLFVPIRTTYAQEFRSLRKFSRRVVARASRPCVSGLPQPQLSLPYTGETPVPLLFGCHFAALSPFVVSKPALHEAGFSRFIEN